MTTERITDDLNRLVSLLPEEIQATLASPESKDQLLEVVLDLGRIPEARYSGWSTPLGNSSITRADLQAMVERVGQFGSDNRAGIERTLHRISAIRNRRGDVVGLTCRVGRAVFGTVAMVREPSAAIPTTKPAEPMERVQMGICGVAAMEPFSVASKIAASGPVG